jgi:hypothetical protein
MAEDLYAFRKPDADKILLGLRSKGVRPIPKSELIPDDGPIVWVALTTSEITARIGTTAGYGTAKVQRLNDDDDFEPHTSVLDDIDIKSSLGVSIPSGKYIVVGKSYADGKWFVIEGGKRPRIRGIISGGNLFTQATHGDPHTLESIEGIDELWDGDSEIEIYNPEGIKMWNGATARCEWNATQERYEVYAVTSDHVVHGIKRNLQTCLFNKLDGANGWNPWDENANMPWIKDVYQVGCEVVYETTCGDTVPFLNLSSYVTNVAIVGDCVRVFRCGGSLAGTQLFCFTKCEEDPPPTCTPATFQYRAGINPANGQIIWQDSSSLNCASPCANPPPPSTPPTALGQTVDVPCVT